MAYSSSAPELGNPNQQVAQQQQNQPERAAYLLSGSTMKIKNIN